MKPEERKERENEIDMAYKQMLDKSSLAQTLKQIYIDLQMAGEVNIMLNNWVRVSCCLPHRSVPINCSLSQDKVFYILTNAERFFKPYYGLLLLSDQSSLQSSLPLDSSSTLNTLLKHLRSSYTMARLSIETSIPLTQIYRLAAHLLYWGRVKIIFPIVDDNYYVIAPDADLSKNSSLSKLYAQTFQHSTVCYTTLQEALAEYSDSIPFHLHGVQCETDHELRERLRCVEWLLKHRLIVQLHYYYYLLIKDDRNEHLDEFKRSRHPKPRVTHRLTSEIPVSSLSHGSPLSSYSTISLYNDQMIDQSNNSNSNLQDDVFPTTILPLRYLFQIEQALPDETNDYRQRVATAINNSNENDVNQFLKIAKYLNGEHHLEEIIYLESLTRTQILSTIESFQHIVIKALHVDPNLVLQI
ncbi:unnamed protein product [Didymodactylos carnosus]|uniref:GATOR complex protein NPRL3 n=1 Tax=Didymodactylos carnosus TaxID=1234261 RepID=A0A813PAX2_9BILA|nr:unnamed protein product [Didymodactylos carnosus]CAF1173493.1 unnamed protein product [Didymodactylos carnosus]CAF3532296.1 unnamed protein product [Didymodactylos carnosus]CAF3984749.1 unnamed protein product [Didymodactylos carnosus]